MTALTLSVGLWAQSVGDKFVDETSGLKFEITAVGETNTVTVIANHYSVTSCTVPATVSYKSVTFNVTEIGDEAFAYCSGLTSVTIGNSVTTIGNNTFYGCSSLTSVTIPNSVTTIGEGAFYGCYGLTSVTIPNSVTTIEYSAFSYCYGLTSVTIGNSVTTIGGLAFCGCSGLTSVTIPNSVTTIGDYAIYGCSGLTSVTIGNSVTTIGQGAFYGCSALTSVTFLGNACQNAIGEMAFMNVGDPNPALLTLPNSWTGTLPSEDGYWYGGKFELKEVPTALPTLFGANVDTNKFLYNGQLIIRKDNKTYNTLGAEL